MRKDVIVSLLLFASCVPSFDVPLERLDEKVIHGDDIDVHWWTTSSISTTHEHVEVVRGGEVRKVSELNAGGIDSIGIQVHSLIIYSSGGLFYQLDDSVFGYRVVLDTASSSRAMVKILRK